MLHHRTPLKFESIVFEIMQLFMKMALTVFLNVGTILAYSYEFVPESDRLFTPCLNHEEHSMFRAIDTTNLTMEFVSDETWSVGGSFTPVWDAEPSDSFTVHFNVEMWQRGQWIPTPVSMTRRNFCEVMYKPDEYWYSVWFKHIYEEDRVCLTHKGAVFRVHPTEMNSVFHDVPMRLLDGRYKIILDLELFDKRGIKKDTRICSEIIGELFKLK